MSRLCLIKPVLRALQGSQNTVARAINENLCLYLVPQIRGHSLDGKFTDTSEEETAIRRAFMNNSRTRVLLMTGKKIGTSYMHTLCEADEIDHIFSDKEIPEDIIKRMRH